MNLEQSGRWAAYQQLLRSRDRQQSGHFPNHGQHQPLVTIGKSCAVLLDLRQEANLVLRKFAERLLRFAVARRLGPGKKIRERNVHGFRDFGERFERRDGVAVLDARKVATQKAGAALDVALRQSALAAIALDDFTDVYTRFFFWHGLLPEGVS